MDPEALFLDEPPPADGGAAGALSGERPKFVTYGLGEGSESDYVFDICCGSEGVLGLTTHRMVEAVRAPESMCAHSAFRGEGAPSPLSTLAMAR